MIDDTKILQHLATQEVRSCIKQVLDVWLLRLLRSSQPCCSLCQIWLALVTWPCTACVGPSTVHQHGAPARCTSTVHPTWLREFEFFFALTDDGLFFQQLISSWERFLLLRLHRLGWCVKNCRDAPITNQSPFQSEPFWWIACLEWQLCLSIAAAVCNQHPGPTLWLCIPAIMSRTQVNEGGDRGKMIEDPIFNLPISSH